jgi:hypothetical protein
MEGLGEAFSVVGKTLLKIQRKIPHPDKPIPQSFILPHSPISIISPVYIPEEKQFRKNSQLISQTKILILLPLQIQIYLWSPSNDLHMKNILII